MKIIGFSGKKQSGKTTVASSLIIKLACAGSDDATRIDFADGVRRLVCEYFLNPEEHLNKRPISSYTNLESESVKKRKHRCGLAYREIMQKIGTDIARKIWPEVWLDYYKMEIEEEILNVVITADVRFVNEVKCIQDLGGHVIRLLRAPFPEDKHESEMALDNLVLATNRPEVSEFWHKGNLLKFDAIIDNRNLDIPTQNQVIWELVNSKGWL